MTRNPRHVPSGYKIESQKNKRPPKIDFTKVIGILLAMAIVISLMVGEIIKILELING